MNGCMPMGGPGIPPGPTACCRGLPRTLHLQSQGHQLTRAGPRSAPLLPHDLASAPTPPSIQPRERVFDGRSSTVADPSTGETVARREHRADVSSSSLRRDLTSPLLGPCDGPRGWLHARAEVVRHRVAQACAMPRTIHPACAAVPLPAEALFEEPRQRGPHPFAGPLATDVHVRVVRVAADPVSSAFQLLVNVIHQPLGSERGPRTAWRHPRFALTAQSVWQDASVQIPSEELQEPFGRDLAGHTAHPHGVIDPGETCLQVEIHDPAIPLFAVVAHGLAGLVCAPARSEPLPAG